MTRPSTDRRAGPRQAAPESVREQRRQDYRDLDAAALPLVRRAQTGELSAFSELALLIAPRLYRYFTARGFRHADAEDLVQETCLRAYQHLASFDPRRPFLPWLFTIASRLAAGQWRRQKPSEPLPADLVSREARPGDSLARQDRSRHVWQVAQRELSQSQFDVLWLHYAENLSVADVAAALKRSQVSVKVLLHRGRKALQTALTRDSIHHWRGDLH